MSVHALQNVLVTGGAGYVGSLLVPRLLARGHNVRVLDLYLYGEEPLAPVRDHPGLREIHADLRDTEAVRAALSGVDAVIHLAAISNDPSCDLDPELTRTVNLESFEPLVRMARDAGVRRFIFASSSSVYGISDATDVREDHVLRPITLYNRYKGECEGILFRYQSQAFTTVAVRPATLCGRAPRQRLDLAANILTTHAVERGVITVFGGTQQRPNLHLQDMARVYELLLDVAAERIAGEAFNVGGENMRVADIARRVCRVLEGEDGSGRIRIETSESNDPRSYHVCSDKIRERLGFEPQAGIDDAIRELAAALRAGELPNALSDSRYYNVKRMQQLNLR